MTETTTPTEEVVDTSTGSEVTDLPEDTTNESAVEQVDDTASEETDQGSQDSSTEDNGEKESDEASSDLKRFAKSQGFDPENLTPGEVKALSIAQKQVSQTRKKMQVEAEGGVEKNIKSISKDSNMSDREYFEFRMAQRDMVDNVRQYWLDNPDDKKYEAEAVAILSQEKERYGDEAMMRLAENMPRLIREAKFAGGAFDSEAHKQQGRKEERERLNRIQQGAADGMDARVTDAGNKDEVTDEWIRNEYDPSNEEHRQRLDSFLASRGKVY